MSEVARRRRRGMSRRIGIAAIALSLVAGACSSDDNSSDTSPADTSDSSSEEVDIVAEAKRITELAKAGLVYAAQDSGTASSDIVAQTEWFGPTEPVSSIEEGKNVQVIMCSSGTACEVAANFVVEAAESVGWTADIIDGQFNPEVWLTAFDTAISKKPDAIIGIAIPDVAVDAKLKAARDAGIVTVSIADTPQGNTTNPYDAYVSYRMPLMHQVLAYATIAETDGAANIVLINDSAFPNLVESNVQFSRVLGQCSGCSVTQVDWTTGDALDPVKTDAVITAALASNPNANYVVLPYSIGMASAIEAVRKAGKSETVKVVAKDGDAFALGLVAKGDSPFNAGVGLDWVAYAGIDQVARGLAGDTYVSGESTGLGIHLWTTADSQADGSSDYTQWLDFKAQYKTLWGVG
jgi:ribose transport system substrate-binding protein